MEWRHLPVSHLRIGTRRSQKYSEKVKAGQMWAALPFSVDENAFRRIRMLSSAGVFRGTCLRASADFCDFVTLTVAVFLHRADGLLKLQKHNF
jgi:hypothetical protein